VNNPPGTAEYGTFVQVEQVIVQGALEDAFGLDKISQEMVTKYIKSGKGVVNEGLGKVGAFSFTFKTSIMLPAGELFEFVGLDTDKFGNLYSNINYATPRHKEVA
jgi:hypothetical protein